MGKGARFDTWAKAEICTLKKQGVKLGVIQKQVKKKDGKKGTIGAINKILKKKRENPEWRGEEDLGSRGRPPSLTPEQQEKLLKFVIKHRGGHKVTASFCKKFLLFLKKACRQVVCATLTRSMPISS